MEFLRASYETYDCRYRRLKRAYVYELEMRLVNMLWISDAYRCIRSIAGDQSSTVYPIGVARLQFRVVARGMTLDYPALQSPGRRALRTITRRDSAESPAENSLILASSAAGGSAGRGGTRWS